jgi:hypothetical protein
MLIGICLLGLALACSRTSEDPRYAAFRFITVTTTGPVRVSFSARDGASASPEATAEWLRPERVQYFKFTTTQPVIARFELTEEEPVTIIVEVWDRGHTFLAAIEEVTKVARFALTEPPGTVGTLTFSRDTDFDDLRLEIDHGADGTIDAERAPDTVKD